MSTAVRDEIASFILLEVLADEQGDALQPDTPLLNGLIDSWALMQLVVFLEDRFNLTVEPEEIVDANFHSLEAISAFVEQKGQSSDP
ncbi:MAG: acyl carrier protein [Actinobacteria bacterium]|nr:acyl carrier protein [Actinomycetota bacterium]MDQ3533192.1 acyl carrier protein [Actinomycetota bacterium]